jgi:Flp pilus assembly protein TadD
MYENALARCRSVARAAVLLAPLILIGGCAGTVPSSHITATSEEGRFAQVMRIADATRAGGDPGAAAALYQRAHALAPNRMEPLIALGETAAAIGAKEEAVRAFRAAVALDRRNVAARRGLGRALIATNEPEEAAEHFRAAMEMDPRDHRVFNGLGVALDLAGQHGRAQEVYLDGIERAPDNLTLRNNLALSFALTGRHDQAIEMLRTAAADPSAGGRVRQNLALVYALSGQIDRATAIAGHDLSGRELQRQVDFYQSLAKLSDRELVTAVLSESGRREDRALHPNPQPSPNSLPQGSASPLPPVASPVQEGKLQDLQLKPIPVDGSPLPDPLGNLPLKNDSGRKPVPQPLSPLGHLDRDPAPVGEDAVIARLARLKPKPNAVPPVPLKATSDPAALISSLQRPRLPAPQAVAIAPQPLEPWASPTTPAALSGDRATPAPTQPVASTSPPKSSSVSPPTPPPAVPSPAASADPVAEPAITSGAFSSTNVNPAPLPPAESDPTPDLAAFGSEPVNERAAFGSVLAPAPTAPLSEAAVLATEEAEARAPEARASEADTSDRGAVVADANQHGGAIAVAAQESEGTQTAALKTAGSDDAGNEVAKADLFAASESSTEVEDSDTQANDLAATVVAAGTSLDEQSHGEERLHDQALAGQSLAADGAAAGSAQEAAREPAVAAPLMADTGQLPGETFSAEAKEEGPVEPSMEVTEAPQTDDFLTDVLAALSRFFGFGYDSVARPGEIRSYCSENASTWIYDAGRNDFLFCGLVADGRPLDPWIAFAD